MLVHIIFKYIYRKYPNIIRHAYVTLYMYIVLFYVDVYRRIRGYP